MKLIPRALACLLLWTALCVPAMAETVNIDAEIDAIFRQEKTVGGAVLVALNGELVYERYYGWASVKGKRPIDRDSYFRAASVTKFVSGIGAMSLVERGLLELDADIGGALGMTIRNPRYPGTPVTLRQLMTHTSGVNDNGGYTKLSSTLRSMFAKNPRGNFTERRPGQTFEYSNFGAGIVGAMMEAVTGQSVQAYMDERVFDPMGIDAAFSPSLLADPEDVVNLYSGQKVKQSAKTALAGTYDDTCDPNMHFRTTVGSLWIRPRDLLKLTSALCEGGALNGVRLLEPETVALMTASQSGVGSVTGETSYGLFTNRVTSVLPDLTLYGHQGTSSGFVCSAYFEPVSGYAFVLMTNGADQRRDHNINVLARKLIVYTYGMTVGTAAE